MTFLICLSIFTWYQIVSIADSMDDLSGLPLFLTPYIKSGKIEEAQALAGVHNLSSDVRSYSGLITVDEKSGLHTFFWFFPAMEDPENAPILLWCDGGPGVTGLLSVFVENGPFLIDSEGKLQLSEKTWTKTHSMIYMDQPMDVGYSIAENEAGYLNSGIAAAPNIYQFLMQFFKLFPHLAKNDFYNSGVSFGGIYAPAAMHYIHVKNNEDPEIKINLKGLLLETPFSDPINQIDYGDYLYHTGLIDDHARAHFKERTDTMKDLIRQEKFLEAQEINLELLWGSPLGTYFTKVTGFTGNYNILKDKVYESQLAFAPFVQTPSFRKSIHVGNLTFNLVSSAVQKLFRPNILRCSVRPMIQELLDLDYKVLIYAGNLDIITSHIGVDAMIKNLEWKGATEYAQAPRQIWRVGDELAGYVKSSRNFTYVLMRNAGHGALGDQAAWGYDLVHKFTTGTPFSN